jgi:soluble lytic murein transglycosylase
VVSIVGLAMTFRPHVSAIVLTAALAAFGSSREARVGARHGVPLQNDDAPTLPSPTFPGVVALLKEPAQALAALDVAVAGRGDAAPIEALVLRAHLLSDLRRYQESVTLWDEIARRDAALQLFAGRSAIADLLAARDVGAAASRIRTAVGARPRRQDDPLLASLADAYQAAGQPAAASDIYSGVILRGRDSAIADRARLGLAKSEEAAGRLDAALNALHQATTAWRLADTFSTARSEERRVAARLHREAAGLTAPQYFAVAARLATSSRFDDAVALLEEGTQRRLLPGDKAEAAVIENLYRGRHSEAAIARAARFLAKFPASRLASSVRLVQLRLDIRLGKLSQARAQLESLQADSAVPASVRQSAQRLVAANLVAVGAPRDGLAIDRQLLRVAIARRDRFDLCWRAGIAAIRAGEDQAAIDLLSQARKYAPARSTPRSTLYWRAVVLDRSGQSPEARRVLAQLVSENAYDYYGIRAADRLQGAGGPAPPLPSSPFPPVRVGDVAAASPEFRTAIVLAKAGLLDDASAMFGAAVARFRADAGVALLAARAATTAGDYATAAALVSTRFGAFLTRPSRGIPDDLWRMAFPRAYWTEVQGAAARSAVDPLLLLSLMRRESRFVVTARSRTGALGLFQIMPYTAREIVPAAKEAAESESLLGAPASADMAARLVKRIVTRFGGATAPVVAAYNAGEDRVEDWWRASRDVAEDLFVDSIPYGETRQYVREVLANYATYKRLYGN